MDTNKLPNVQCIDWGCQKSAVRQRELISLFVVKLGGIPDKINNLPVILSQNVDRTDIKIDYLN